MRTRERDLRLDFCRGIALIIIFIDHVPGNPLANCTLRNFAFCDAAEIFVLISGIASYLAYGSLLERGGFLECTKAVARRWVRVYLAHLLLFFAVAAFIVIASRHFSGADYLEWLKLKWLTEEPGKAILSALTLSYLPRLLDILPLYLILLGFVPLFLFLVNRDYRLALLASGTLYALTWTQGWNLTAGCARGWYFDPFAWQFLYAIGMTIGHVCHAVPEGPRWHTRWLFASIGFLVFAALVTGPLSGNGFTEMAPLRYLWQDEKTYLSPLRLINILALVYVFGFFVSPQAPWLKARSANLFLACGRHSLPIYGAGVLLSCVGYVLVNESGSKTLATWMLNFLGIAAMFLLALALDRFGRRARPATSIAGTPRPLTLATHFPTSVS